MVDFVHDRLIAFLDDEANRRGMTLNELSEAMGLNPSQLYNIRHGRQPGLKVCLDIARYTHNSIGYILFLAGHICEDEVVGLTRRSPKLDRLINTLDTMQDGPLFDETMRVMLEFLDIILHKIDAASENVGGGES